mmetsp:Transcript_87477/g.283226  ORF Transcript_87477/g.283226 Transcript_87477/m.283226 type:complete len:239 (+) Transcript_87477:159-875(+)
MAPASVRRVADLRRRSGDDGRRLCHPGDQGCRGRQHGRHWRLELRRPFPLRHACEVVVVVGQPRLRLVAPPRRHQVQWGRGGWWGWLQRTGARPPEGVRAVHALVPGEHHLASALCAGEDQHAVCRLLGQRSLLWADIGHEGPLAACLTTGLQEDVHDLAVPPELRAQDVLGDVIRQRAYKNLLGPSAHWHCSDRLGHHGVLTELALVPRKRHLAGPSGPRHHEDAVRADLGELSLLV